MEKYILNYMREHSNDELTSHYIDLFKNDLDTMLYGNNPSFMGRNLHLPSKYSIWKSDMRRTIKRLIKPNKADRDLKNVLSTMYFGTNEDFLKYNMKLYSTPLRPLANVIDKKPLRELRNLYFSMLQPGTFMGMLNKEKITRLETLKEEIAEIFVQNKIKAFFTHNDEEFCNKYLAEICQMAGIPSFEFLHGLPGVYTQSINTGTDYLCVWGEQIKANYIKNGFVPERIFVTGAPRFSHFMRPVEKLRNSFEDVLVAPSGACIWIQHGWVMDEHGDQNDSLLVLYIYQVEHVLKQFGIKHARLRPHQTVDKKWVAKYIDTDFYSLDYESVNDSLGHSTMVIGPHSTLMMDALCNGVNYYVYDPGEGGYTVRGAKIVPPYDGMNEYVKVAQTEDELVMNLKEKKIINQKFLDGYLCPFDLTPIINLF